ncbi:recombinase RecT [Streptomyces sp. ALI-76-A]|uniref:recombinase RecT n=1 Tax=Streptomyces sp. ALI-76-A TaxID=3025736 RepID=UPI00256EDB13|nr:recombinase RecT [Streptomyces sp. ALI-76-A]MDL5205079.1 recombinase RecT [Streptomyces sp. ALI-76-A]
MSDNTVGNAIATRDNGPEAIVRQHREDLTLVLPTHVKGETWMRLATGALRRDANLRQVAARNPGSLMNALLECARLGHEPGTEAFYLVPFGQEVQGIEGYRGIIERIYRAGAVKAVKAEVVYENDQFKYHPGMDRPEHEPDYFSDRGRIVGAYAYGVFEDGSTSKVVVINRSYIDKVKKESKGSDRASSPWVKWEEGMVLKTVARRLEPWVPTAVEWRNEQPQVQAEAPALPAAAGPPAIASADPDASDDEGPIEAEFVDDEPAAGWPAAATPGSGARP